jgi:ABC-type sugar transport system ATPase subunit
LVEIMRAFYRKPRLLILDEPTASLGEGEIEPFLKFIKSLKEEQNVSIIYITHKLEEIMEIADRVTVLADGAVTLRADIAGLRLDDCIHAMLRSDKIKQIHVSHKIFDRERPVLDVRELEFDGKLRQLNLQVCRGEVVGLYGLVGSGRTEAMEALFGIRRCAHKQFMLDGETITSGSSYEMIRKGVILTPELRANGVFPRLSLTENICNLFTERFSTRVGVVKNVRCKQFSTMVLDKNLVRYVSQTQQISELSGGNMQKVIIGRSIEVENLKLIIFDEPTAGMDLGAKSEIYIKIRSLADEQHAAVLFVSSELDELISVCDRISVFYRGNRITDFPRKDFIKEKILSYAVKGADLDE